MLSFFKTRTLEQKAKRLWNNGEILQNWESPKLGAHWDAKLLPFWRKWITDLEPGRDFLKYDVAFSTVHDDDFWAAAFTKINSADVLTAQIDAAQRGNISVFKASSENQLRFYASYILQGGPRQARIVHPDVSEWMVEHKYWATEILPLLSESHAFFDKHSNGIGKIESNYPGHSSVDISFVQSWALRVLRDHGLNADQQASFIGNIMCTFRGDVWFDNVAPLCLPFLQQEVDISILSTVYGCETWVPEGEHISPEMLSVYESVRAISMHMRKQLMDSSSTTDIKDWKKLNPFQEANSLQPGIALMLDLMPPESPMDLYRIGCKIKQMQLDSSQVMESYTY